MNSTSPVSAPGFPIAEKIDRALGTRFVLTADRSIHLSQRMTEGSILDLGSFGLRSQGPLGVEQKVSHGIFRLHTVGEIQRTHDVTRAIFRGHLKSKRRSRNKPLVGTTHELVDLGCRFPEKVINRDGSLEEGIHRVVAFGTDDFTFKDGEDMPHASILSWSLEQECLVLTSELFFAFKWLPTDSVLLWA